MAVSVTRIMPVLYSLLIASTAMIATIAWPTWTPVRLSLAGSAWQPTDPQVEAASTAAPTAIVSAAAASSSQPVPGSVRSLVHSACSVS